MRRTIWLFLLTATLLLGSMVEQKRWPQGETLLGFLSKNGIPAKLYYGLDREEKELASEIRAGSPYIVLKDANGTIEHLLVPISEELQIHIYKDGKYKFRLDPIHYQKIEDAFSLAMEHSPYVDILRATDGNKKLANEFVSVFKHSVDFSHSIRKGDKLAIIYSQKLRLGEPFGMPTIQAAMVEAGGRRYYIFNYHDRYYDEKGKELESFFLKRPVRNARITSRFTRRRWHPILHRYRAHLGVDFGARRGTPVVAAGDGRVLFAGRKGGYGKVVIIYHGQGYKTLYAHLSKFRRGIRAGKRVRQGQVIGYVGSTGLSTGPHLHFGLYKKGRAINPLSIVKITKSRLSGKKLKEFKQLVKRYKKELEDLAKKPKAPNKVEFVKSLVEYKGGEDGKS